MAKATREDVLTQSAHDIRTGRLKLAVDMLELLVTDGRRLPVVQQRQLRTALANVRGLHTWCLTHPEGEPL